MAHGMSSYAESRDYKSRNAKLAVMDEHVFAASRNAIANAGIFAGSHTAYLLVLRAPLTYSQFNMQDRTETLAIGARAPDFSLPSANWESSLFTLSTMLGRGPVIVEFLRGTW
jgi:hypothetical protein